MDLNATEKPKAVRAAMTAFMDQDWKDLVQDKLEKATTVAEMNKIMATEMNVIWPNTKDRSYTFSQNKNS